MSLAGRGLSRQKMVSVGTSIVPPGPRPPLADTPGHITCRYNRAGQSLISGLCRVPGGNYILANTVQEGSAQGKSTALFPSGRDWADARTSAGITTSNHDDMHAGELETSILLHVHPELVRDGYQAADWLADDRRHLLTTGMSEYTQNGVIGRPSLASAEKGKAVLASLTTSFASVLEILRGALPTLSPSDSRLSPLRSYRTARSHEAPSSKNG